MRSSAPQVNLVAMQLLALALVALFVFLLVSRFAKRRRGGAGSLQQEAAIEAWARAEMARLIAERLELEESDVATTLAGNPDPELVTRLEKSVSGIEVVYERALGATGSADVRVEVRLESGALERSVKRIAFSELPESVRLEFEKTGTAHVYRPWTFPWRQ
ncbi:MAG: hypothetical protein IPM79_31960 [Polyangiaceae bacterium]|nr:hypothetical protein [Polyangiaceae bacterium]MBK8942097.1 hypothetical protein [Polyangiaceae bacterium]